MARQSLFQTFLTTTGSNHFVVVAVLKIVKLIGPAERSNKFDQSLLPSDHTNGPTNHYFRGIKQMDHSITTSKRSKNGWVNHYFREINDWGHLLTTLERSHKWDLWITVSEKLNKRTSQSLLQRDKTNGTAQSLFQRNYTNGPVNHNYREIKQMGPITISEIANI